MPLSSNSLEYEELAVGVASALGCLLIVLTYILFPNLRKLRYIELVFYVAINDLIASIAMALGPSNDGSAACWFQGLSTTGNYLSSVFWTSIITYQVYEVVVNEGSVLRNMSKIHYLCWGLPLFLTFIPLSTSTYSNPDDESTWCFVADRHNSPPWSQLFWFIASFYVWLWAAMICSAYMLVAIALKLRRLQVVPDVILSTIGKLALYPVIITVCWALNTLANIYTFSKGQNYGELSRPWTIVANMGVIMALLQGLFNALVFFAANPLVREHWACLLRRVLCCMEVDEDNGEEKDDQGDVESDLTADQLRPTVDDGADRAGTQHHGSLLSVGPRSSAHQTARDVKMALSVEDQADFVGEARLSSAAASGKAGTAEGEGYAAQSMVSTDHSVAPLSAVMNGLTRTASGEQFISVLL